MGKKTISRSPSSARPRKRGDGEGNDSAQPEERACVEALEGKRGGGTTVTVKGELFSANSKRKGGGVVVAVTHLCEDGMPLRMVEQKPRAVANHTRETSPPGPACVWRGRRP